MRSIISVLTAALFATVAMAGPIADKDATMAGVARSSKFEGIMRRDYSCNSCALGPANCNDNNAPKCSSGDCACCCASISNNAPTASLPPVGKR